MTTTEIKKELYKQKPIALLDYEFENFKWYYAIFNDGTKVRFKIPLNECEFGEEVPAQLLIRWMV